MSSITDLYRKRRSTSVASCDPPAALCSSCGMLECLCRPRFFAGQVLNADDLNRLDAYVRGKHRLHNRQLHGFGVVNGLEVTCNPCGDGVTVSCGYALSPCGDDIVVCDAVTVDICDLINRCCKNERVDPCDPPRPARTADCPAAEEEWVLAIRYAETPTRGVKPLYGASSGGCQSRGSSCGGGGGCACGGAGAKSACGCGASSGGSSYKSVCTCGGSARPRTAPVQCEATAVCEGYVFEVYRAPATTTANNNDKTAINTNDSALLQRFKCCVDDLFNGAPAVPVEAVPNDVQGWYQWAIQFKAHLLRRLQQRPGTNCELLDRLATLAVPQPNGQNTAALVQAVLLLFVVFIDALLNCLCSALLPPCPAPSDDDRVALATIHVARNPCHVQRVCNWSTQRQIAVTMPALEYWFSVLPLTDLLRELLQKMCCFDLSNLLRLRDARSAVAQPVDQPGHMAFGAAPRDPAVAGAAAASEDDPLTSLIKERATLRLNPRLDNEASLQASTQSLMRSLFTPSSLVTPEFLAQGLLARKGQSAVDALQLPQLLLQQQFARPLGAALGPEVLAALRGSTPGAAQGNNAVAELTKTVQALGERMQQQERQLAQLRQAQAPGPATGNAAVGAATKAAAKTPTKPAPAKRGRK